MSNLQRNGEKKQVVKAKYNTIMKHAGFCKALKHIRRVAKKASGIIQRIMRMQRT